MGQKERDIINRRLSRLEPHERLFRINAGMGWVAEKSNTAIIKNKNGSINVFLKNARPFHGAPPGWLDLCGWTEIEVTSDMVGKHLAVFTFEEIKTQGLKIKSGSMQALFRDLLIRMGGVFRILK